MFDFALILFGSIAISTGRLLFGRWFNHVTIYSSIWTASLLLFRMRLIHYYPLSYETWIVILAGWGMFLIGSIWIPSAKFASGVIERWPAAPHDGFLLWRRTQMLERGIWVTTAIASVAILQHWYILLKLFGSVQNALIMSNLVYRAAVQNQLPGQIPYVSSLCLTGSFLGGILSRVGGRIRPVAFMPILATFCDAVAMMGRAEILISFLLFLTGFVLMHRPNIQGRAIQSVGRLKRIVLIACVVVLAWGGMEFVRSSRGVSENIAGSSQALGELRNSSFITPSVYMYCTVHFGVLNKFLERSKENLPIGANTLAPIYHILSKFGVGDRVPEFQTFYNTPIGANTGTYLREVVADFGIGGAFVVPFLLGLTATHWWNRIRQEELLIDVAILSHLYIVVFMSIFVMPTRIGGLSVSLIASLIICRLIDQKSLKGGSGSIISVA